MKCHKCHIEITEETAREWAVPFDARRIYGGRSVVHFCLDTQACEARIAASEKEYQERKAREDHTRMDHMRNFIAAEANDRLGR